MNLLLDSDIVIEVLKLRDQLLLSRWEQLASSNIIVSYPSYRSVSMGQLKAERTPTDYPILRATQVHRHQS
jgi:hypothetical protein